MPKTECGFDSRSRAQIFCGMEKRVRFFKQDGKWYADIPNHTLEENEMVMGADIALDFLSKDGDEVFLTVSDTKPEEVVPLSFHIKEHDDDGAYYTANGKLVLDFMTTFSDIEPVIWICNVTHDVFGEHPDDIYIKGIE